MIKNNIKILSEFLFKPDVNINNFKLIYFSLKKNKKFKQKKLIIFFEKKYFFNAVKIFINFFFKKKAFFKHFFLIYDFKSTIIGNCLFPVWPGKYSNDTFLINLYKWVKLFSYIFLFRKNLCLIVLKIN